MLVIDAEILHFWSIFQTMGEEIKNEKSKNYNNSECFVYFIMLCSAKKPSNTVFLIRYNRNEKRSKI